MHIVEWSETNFRTVNKFYRSQKHKGRANGDERVFVVFNGDEIIASVRLLPQQGYLWLRSLYVKSELRGQKIGEKLLAFVHDQVKEKIYCFPYDHLLPFYQRSGYLLLSDTDLPESLRQLFLRYKSNGSKIIAMSFEKI